MTNLAMASQIQATGEFGKWQIQQLANLATGEFCNQRIQQLANLAIGEISNQRIQQMANEKISKWQIWVSKVKIQQIKQSCWRLQAEQSSGLFCFMRHPVENVVKFQNICDSVLDKNWYSLGVLQKYGIPFLIHLQIVIEFIKFGNGLC